MARLRGIHGACVESGIRAELFDADTVRRVEPQLAPTVQGGLIVESHGFIGVSELTAALRRAAAAHGVSFQTSAAVTRIEGNGAGIRVETSGDAFACESAVMAAGSWSGHVEIDGASPVPIRPVRGQLLHLGMAGAAPQARGVVARLLSGSMERRLGARGGHERGGRFRRARDGGRRAGVDSTRPGASRRR